MGEGEARLEGDFGVYLLGLINGWCHTIRIWLVLNLFINRV